MSELVRVEAREHRAATRTTHRLRGPTTGSRDDRYATRERLGRDDAEALLRRGKNEQPRVAHVGGDVADLPDAYGAGGELLLRRASDQSQLEVGQRLACPCERVQQEADVLAWIVCPPDEHEPWRA